MYTMNKNFKSFRNEYYKVFTDLYEETNFEGH